MTDIFNSNTDVNTNEDQGGQVENNQEQASNERPSLVDELVGEGKRYRDHESLAKGKYEADQYIEKLKGELAEMREELNKRVGAEEVLNQLRSKQDSGKQDTTPALDEETLGKLVSEHMTKAEQQKTAQQNIQTAHNKMVEMYGEKRAVEVLHERASEMGVDKQYMAELAQKSPTAFLRLMGVDSATTPARDVNKALSGSDVRSEAKSFTSNKQSPKEYYDNMRRENPRQYFTPKVQNEIFELTKQGKYE